MINEDLKVKLVSDIRYKHKKLNKNTKNYFFIRK
jgi:hypothetical protein